MASDSNWTDEWLKAQQKVNAAWTEMANDLGSADLTSQSKLWADNVAQWQKNYANNAIPEVRTILDKCMDVGKGYFTMAEQMSKSSTAGANPFDLVNNWLNQVKEMLQQQAGAWSPMNSQSTDELMSQWFSPATSWQKMASTMLPMQQSLGQMPGIGTSAFNMGDAIDPLGKLLTAPGIGYFREPQEKLQKGIQLALEYQQSNAKYNMAFVRVSVESIQKFQQLLQNQATGQDSEGMPSSLRDLYDQWIIVSEEHHADFAMSEEYQAIYGDMVNRLMALKKHYNEMLDDMMKNMNLPTRSETDTMQLRLQQLRRENFSLHSEIREIKAMLVKDKKSPAPKAAIKKSAAVKKVSTRSKPKSKAGA